MASRDYTKHFVSTSEPSSPALGDEWYNPSTDRLYKRIASDGTTVSWREVPTSRTDTLGNIYTNYQHFKESSNTSSVTGADNSLIPVSILAPRYREGIPSVDVVLSPLGEGANLAQNPDGTIAGGNKRGLYSTDWQKFRSASSQVASGAFSTIAGGNGNTASGLYSSAMGLSNNAAGTNSTAIGSSNTASSTYTCAFGHGNNVTALHGMALGSYNTVNQTAAIAVSYSSITSGSYSSAFGGCYGNTRGISGYTVFPAHIAPIDSGANQQSGILMLGRVTAAAGAAILTSTSSLIASTANTLTLPNNSVQHVRGSVIATVTGGGNSKVWTFEGVLKRGISATNTSIVGAFATNIIAADAGASTWTIALAADTTLGGLRVTVTGQTGVTIRWSCRLETNEVSF